MKDLETIQRSHLFQSFPRVALLSLLLYGASVNGLPGSFNARVAAQSATRAINSALPIASEVVPTKAADLSTDRSSALTSSLPASGAAQYGAVDASPMAATTGVRSVLDSSDIYVDSTIDRLQQSARPELPNHSAATAIASVLPHNGLTAASVDSLVDKAVPISRNYANQMIRFPKQTAAANLELRFPLSIPAAITSAFGWRVHPLMGDRRFHSGTDLGAPLGTPVLAAYAGNVAIADFLGGYGLTVTLTHNQGAQETLYGHLSEIFVKPGEWVEQGTVIGLVGSTGVSTGPHLHFELQQRTEAGWFAVDPGEQLEYALVQLIKRMQIAQTKPNFGT